MVRRVYAAFWGGRLGHLGIGGVGPGEGRARDGEGKKGRVVFSGSGCLRLPKRKVMKVDYVTKQIWLVATKPCLKWIDVLISEFGEFELLIEIFED